MNKLGSINPISLLACIVMLMVLSACERESYTSWSCNTANETKIPMILRKAQMELKGNKLDFCGSLGNQSYFDLKCPAQTEQSSAILTPSSGHLIYQNQDYQCTAL